MTFVTTGILVLWFLAVSIQSPSARKENKVRAPSKAAWQTNFPKFVELAKPHEDSFPVFYPHERPPRALFSPEERPTLATTFSDKEVVWLGERLGGKLFKNNDRILLVKRDRFRFYTFVLSPYKTALGLGDKPFRYDLFLFPSEGDLSTWEDVWSDAPPDYSDKSRWCFEFGGRMAGLEKPDRSTESWSITIVHARFLRKVECP